MGVIQQKWQKEQSRIEDGIFFGSDEWVALVGAPDAGYTIGTRQPVAGVIASAPDGWCDLVETVTARDERGGLSIHAGETSWEGEGFIAVVATSTGQLRWLFHCSASESFVEVVADGEVIRAVSGGYPMRYEWSIPIHAPERFTVESCRAA
jgi:hypothetical protein